MRSVVLRVLAISTTAALSGCSAIQPVQVASGLTGHLLCSETFVSGLDPATVYSERVKGLLPRPVELFVHYDVDTAHREVTTTVAGVAKSRTVYRDGLGCLVVRGEGAVDTPPPADPATTPRQLSVPALPALPAIAGAAIVEPANEKLRAALDRAFVNPDRPPHRYTRAVVVVHNGKVVAERYGPGVGIDTPLLSFSVAKSVTNALVGILVRQGRLSLDGSAPLPAWRDPGDPRHAITINQLLRQTSGIALAQTNSGFDPNARMLFVERDMAAFAQNVDLEATPGSRWAYTDGNYILLSRIVRDAVGGQARDVLRFAQRELFEPLGMRNVTLEFDATGTPVGAVFMLAAARDWARFGQLYLNDGVAGGVRILPETWVHYSSSPTLDTGYGAGWWTNLVSGNVPAWGVPWGMAQVPKDAFFARGFMGQYIVVVPSERLVVVRFGASYTRGDDIESADNLVADVIVALHSRP